MCHSEWKISTVVIRQCKYGPTFRYARDPKPHFVWVGVREKPQCVAEINTVEFHLSGLIGTASYPDMQKIRITGFFLENRLHWQFEVGKKICKWLFLATYLFTYK